MPDLLTTKNGQNIGDSNHEMWFESPFEFYTFFEFVMCIYIRIRLLFF